MPCEKSGEKQTFLCGKKSILGFCWFFNPWIEKSDNSISTVHIFKLDLEETKAVLIMFI